MNSSRANKPQINWSIEYSSESSISLTGSSTDDNKDQGNAPTCQSGRRQNEPLGLSSTLSYPKVNKAEMDQDSCPCGSPHEQERPQRVMEPQPSRHISFAHEMSYQYPSSSSANSGLSNRMVQTAPEQDWENYSDEGICSPCNSTGGPVPNETFEEGYSYLDRDQRQAPMKCSRKEFMENQRYFEQERDPFTAGIPRRDKAKPGRYDAAGPGRLAQRKQKAYPVGSSPYQEHQHEIDVYANEPRGPRRPYSPPMGRLPARLNSSFREDEEYVDNRWSPNFGDISNVKSVPRARASSASPRMMEVPRSKGQTYKEKPAPKEQGMTPREEEILRTHYKTKYLEGRDEPSDACPCSSNEGDASNQDAANDNAGIKFNYESEIQATAEQAGENSGSSVSVSITSELSVSASSGGSAESSAQYPFTPGNIFSPLRSYSGDSSDYRTPPRQYQPTRPPPQQYQDSTSGQSSASSWPSPQSDWSSDFSKPSPQTQNQPQRDVPSQSTASPWLSYQSEWSSNFSTSRPSPQQHAVQAPGPPKIVVTAPTPERKLQQTKDTAFRPLGAQSTPASASRFRGPAGLKPGSFNATPISARGTPGSKPGSCPRSFSSYQRKPSPSPSIPEMNSSPDPPGYDPTWYESSDSYSDRSLEFRKKLEDLLSEVDEVLDSQVSSMMSSSRSPEQEEPGSCPCSSPGKSPGRSRRSSPGRSGSRSPRSSPGRSTSRSPGSSPGQSPTRSENSSPDTSGSPEGLLNGTLSEMIARLKSMMEKEKKGSQAYNAMAECLKELEDLYNSQNSTTSTENSPLTSSGPRQGSPSSESSGASSMRMSLESSSSISINLRTSRGRSSPDGSPRRAVDVAREAEVARQVPKPLKQYAPVRTSLTRRGKYVPPSKQAGNAVKTAAPSQSTKPKCPCPSGQGGSGNARGQPEHFLLSRSNRPEPSRKADNTFQRAKADYFRMNPDVDGKRPTGLRQFSDEYPKPDIDFDPYVGGPDYSAFFAGDSPPSNSPLLRARDAERSFLRREVPIYDPPRAPPRVKSTRGQTQIPEPQFQTTKRQQPPRGARNTMSISSKTSLKVKMGPKPRPSPDIPQATRRTTQGVAWEVPITPKLRAIPVPPPARQPVTPPVRQSVRKAEAWDIPITPKCRAVPVPPPQSARKGEAWDVPVTPPKREKPDPCAQFKLMLSKIPVGTKKYADAIELLADCIKRNNRRQAGLPPPTPFSSQWTGRFTAPRSAVLYEGGAASYIPEPEPERDVPVRPHTPYTGHELGQVPRKYRKRIERPEEKMKVARQLVDQFEKVGRVESLGVLVDEIRKILVG